MVFGYLVYLEKRVLADSRDVANANSDDPEVQDIVSCVALFYEERKSRSSFLREEKFRVQLLRKVKSLKTVKETVR